MGAIATFESLTDTHPGIGDEKMPQVKVQNVYIRRVEKQGEALANIEIATIPMVKDPWKELNPLK